MSQFHPKELAIRKCIHQLNNMITIIQGNAELLLKNDTHMQDEIKDILVGCQRSLDILAELRKLSDT